MKSEAWMPALMHLDDDFFVTLGNSEEETPWVLCGAEPAALKKNEKDMHVFFV